ncbi:hypothetical protein JCM8097_001610 [Rhodosporidiobolus ruineniae]
MAAPTTSAAYTNAHGNPPPPPLSVAGGPPQQGPSVLQILAMGQERNHAADAMAHHPRIESLVKLGKEAEATWLQIGQTAEAVGDLDRAITAYEAALRHNAYSVVALSQIAAICRSKEEFKKAAEYFGRVVGLAPESGDVWGALGHCYLMIDDLKKAYSSYQQALYYMPNPHEPKLWYGIGILYDRYGSLEHAEEAFSSVIRMDPNFEKSNEIFFRLGIIYKQQRKSAQSLECFRYILNNPPRPLTEIDIWFQIGHVYEQQKDFIAAKESYERVLQENPAHAKVLQQLGGLYHRSRAPFYNPEISVQILTRSLESDPNDPFSWYLLGRAYMTTQNFGKAYEAYQQAVYRDGKNPAFWCSIGVLYYNINQFHDALDAYSRAIRIHPYLAEVWFNLGALYEACNDQMTDAIDAYQRTLQLDANNEAVQQRLRQIRDHQTTGAPLPSPPPPKDISPSSLSWNYAINSGGAPTQLGQAGLGPDVSPTIQGPPNGRAGTAGGPGSPSTAHRFDGPPNTAGSRPRSSDPYRRTSGARHSPSASVDQSPRTIPMPPGSASGHRLSGPLSQAPGQTLPQMKMHDSRPRSGVRAGSPPSPRTRPPGENVTHPPHGGYPFPAHLAPHGAGHSNGGPPGPPSSAHDAMEWERTARQGSIPALHRPSMSSSSRHPHSPPLAPGQAPHPLHPAHVAAHHGPPPPGAPQHALRPPFYDNPPPGPYGGYPPASAPAQAAAAAHAAAEEYARRRSSGSTTASHRSSLTETKPLEAGGAAAAAPAAPTPAPKGRGRKKAAAAEGADGEAAPKKEPAKRKGKAAAAADGENGAATTPKKPRKSKATIEKEKAEKAAAAQAKEKEKEAANNAAAVLQAAANVASSPPRPVQPAPAPAPPTGPQRDVDEDYDEGVDALMNLASAATPAAASAPLPQPTPPPPAPAPAAASLAPPVIPPSNAPSPAPSAGGVSPNPRKRSLPTDEAPAASPAPPAPSAAADAPVEPELKRSKSDHAAPTPVEEEKKDEPAKENGVGAPPAPVEDAPAPAPAEEKTDALVAPVAEEKKKAEVAEPNGEKKEEEKEEGEVSAPTATA